MFRNKEIVQMSIGFCAITLVASIIGLFIHPLTCILIIFTSILFSIIFFYFTKSRYNSIIELSEKINLVLHNSDHLFISQADEGELSILANDITKMTIRIREQNHALMKEKVYLAESLADIAHQLRTPLTSANLILSRLKNNVEELERRKLLRDIQRLFDQMDWLITSLLKISRLDAGIISFEKEPLSVLDLIHQSLKPFQISMDLHNIEIITKIPDDTIVYGDMNWLSEAFQNVFKNSLECTKDGEKIEITCVDNPLYVEISIHDNGPGFNKEDIPFLFERFYRGKNTSTAGYGIGLALSKTIITQQGGTIVAQNHPLGGAVFTIRFPK